MLSLMFLAPSAIGDDKAESQEKARQLWETVIAAKGGRERLRSIQSLYVMTKARSGSYDYDLYVFPDRSFIYSYWAAFERIDINVYNGKRNASWWQVNTGPAHTLRDTEDDSEYVKEAQITFLLLTQWLEPKPLRARKDWVGFKRVDVVETDVDGWRVDYYLDAKSNLPLQVMYGYSKIERGRGELNRVVRLEDYKEVAGIKLPHQLTFSFTNVPIKSQQRASYELNVDYDEQIFERPPARGLTPDAWRRRPKQ